MFLLFLLPLLASFELNGTHQVTCSRDLMQAYQTMIQLPEAKEVVDNALKRGCIQVVSRHADGFGGMWDANNRMIAVSPRENQTLGAKINTMMMEFHNAQSDEDLSVIFTKAHNNQIGKEDYVEQVERIEHANTVNSSKLLAKGIEKGLYPKDAAWHIIEDFDDHYKVQQILDHSLWIARNYDQINRYSSKQPYKGTVQGLYHLNEKEKSMLCSFLMIKNDMKSERRAVRERAQSCFARELLRRRSGIHGSANQAYSQMNSQEAKCFDAVFSES